MFNFSSLEMHLNTSIPTHLHTSITRSWILLVIFGIVASLVCLERYRHLSLKANLKTQSNKPVQFSVSFSQTCY